MFLWWFSISLFSRRTSTKLLSLSFRIGLKKRSWVLLIKFFDVLEQNILKGNMWTVLLSWNWKLIFVLPVLNNLLSEVTLLVFGKPFDTFLWYDYQIKDTKYLLFFTINANIPVKKFFSIFSCLCLNTYSDIYQHSITYSLYSLYRTTPLLTLNHLLSIQWMLIFGIVMRCSVKGTPWEGYFIFLNLHLCSFNVCSLIQFKN